MLRAGLLTLLGAALSLLAGCAVGPNYSAPAPPRVTRYQRIPAAPRLRPGAREPAQRLAAGQAIPAEWWHLFHSRSLDRVVRQALAGSPTIEEARARLAEAQESVTVARGPLYPQIDAGAFTERQKGPAFAAGLLHPRAVPTYDLYSLGPTVSFMADVFGATRRRAEEQSALAERQSDELAAAQLSVTGNVVVEALTAASARLQITAIDKIVAEDEKNLLLVRQQYTAGRVDRTDAMLAEARLAVDRIPLPGLKQQLAAAEDALALLVGKAPGNWAPPAFELDDMTLPSSLPISVPSALVHDRPDILAGEAELHASSAAIGVATGRLFPTITLSAALAPTALTPAVLFEGRNLDWSLLSGITAPLFHGGAFRAERRAAVDNFQASLAVYRETVLEGFRQVADTLQALEHDTELVSDARRALNATHAALKLQRIRYAAGKVDLLRLLDAERDFEKARVVYARARAARYINSAQLLVALGGGVEQASSR